MIGFLALVAAVLNAVAAYPPPPPFLSNVFGDHMVLQRGTPAMVYGFAAAGTVVNTTMTQAGPAGASYVLQTHAGSDGVWRQVLPVQGASKVDGSDAWSFHFASNASDTAGMTDVLFGDVHMCTGQSNMQFTVSLGFNATAECAAAAAYTGIRMMSVYDNRSTTPRGYIWPTYLQSWSVASRAAVCPGGWGYLSAACFYTYREIYLQIGVPQGLISNSFGGSRIEEWMSPDAMAACPLPAGPPASPCPVNGVAPQGSATELVLDQPAAAPNCVSAIYNVMVTPYALGPMAIRTLIWYQGEANVVNGFTTQDPNWYACAAAAIVADYRAKLPGLSTWGSFQLGGCVCYPGTLNVSDIRQAQVAPLLTSKTSKFAFASAVDQANFSDPHNIHYPVKQNVSARMADQLLSIEYGLEPHGSVIVPVYQRAEQQQQDPASTSVVVLVTLNFCEPFCVIRTAQCPVADATQCAGFQLLVVSDDFPEPRWLTATAGMLGDGSTVELIAETGSTGASVVATAYGRGNWPLVTLYSNGNDLPVLPWCYTLPQELPCYAAGF